MSTTTTNSTTPRIVLEDALVCLLGLIAGPLLWWMSSLWQQLPATSSAQALEFWIASLCGFLGIALCVLWAVYFLAGFGLVVGLKTRNRVLTYWSEIFAPKFLRRLIISIVGTQLALAAPALASSTDDLSTAVANVQEPEPFMPYVHDETALEEATSSAPVAPKDTSTPQLQAPSSATPNSPSPDNDRSDQSPGDKARQDSHVVVSPQPSPSVAASETVEQVPRHTSTIDVTPEATSQKDHSEVPSNEQSSFTPQQPLPTSPLSEPNPSRTTADPTVVIKSGDCLWDLAAQELGADTSLFEIDRRWRQWWEHNRETIGPDPHVLQPGTILISPPFN